MISIKPKKNISAIVEAPPSKSYTNRALLIASLANGRSILKNPLLSDDTLYMISALREFGIKIEQKDNAVIVHGTGGKLNPPKREIFIGNAGTTMRFVTTLASLADGETVITGEQRMLQRPIGDLIYGLNQLGVKCKSNNGFPPVKVYGGGIPGGKIKIKGDISSQYLSSILMCAPYAGTQVEIEITGELASKPYIDITIDIMQNFGVGVLNVKYKKFSVLNGELFKPQIYGIEGDASNASYFMAAAAVTNGKIKVKNLNPNSKQGDIKFADLLEKMGCEIRKGKNFIEIKGKSLKSINVDMNEMPDAVPTLAIVSLFADSTTVIRNVPNLRVKETDRLSALATELRKVGALVEEMHDGLKINSNGLHGAVIETYNDHRMAMCFAVAGLAIEGIKITNPECVNKSFPEFWKMFEAI